MAKKSIFPNKNDQETIVSSSVLQNSQIMIVKTMYIFQCKRAENLIVLNNKTSQIMVVKTMYIFQCKRAENLIVLNNSVVHNIQKS